MIHKNFKMTELGRTLSDGDVKSLEKELGFLLPSKYREFLLSYNGGRPIPADFPITGFPNNPSGGIQIFLGIDRKYNSSNIAWSYKILSKRIPTFFLPIAGTDVGNLVCLAIGGENEGKVYLWDHENEHTPPTYRNVYLIADSFQAFLNSIYYHDYSKEIAAAGAKLVFPITH